MWTSLVTAAFSLASAGSALAAPVVWSEQSGGNGHSYEAFVVADGLSWDDAVAMAAARGGHLVTITSEEESDFVFDNVVNDVALWKVDTLGFLIGPYIGLFQDPLASDFTEPSGGWRWVTGEDYEYTNWAPGQPNNVNVQNFGLFWAGSSALPRATWQDVANFDGVNTPISFVVEYVPNPSTISVFALGALIGRRRGR